MAGGKQSDEPKVKVFSVGAGGNNLVKDELQLADDECSQTQNAEIRPDVNIGGEGSLSKRGGLAALTSALAGSILGITCLPLLTTYTRTLYASLQEADSDTWLRTTNGTSWTATSTPQQADDADNPPGVITYAAAFRIASFLTKLYYPDASHVTDTASAANNTAPPVSFWDGTSSAELFTLMPGPTSDGNYPFGITDMLVGNNKIYLSTWEPSNSGNIKGRVISFDPRTNEIKQVCNAFGESPGETGGFPVCMAFHLGQLFVGLNPNSGNGKVVRCYPDVDTTWTVDTSNVLITNSTHPVSMIVFKGDLYIGTRGVSGNSTARVVKRTASTGVYSSVDAGSEQGICFYTNLYVYNDELYAVLYEDGVGDNCLIRKSSDGSSWSTDRDPEASDAWNVNLKPTNIIEYNSDLYVSFRSSTKTATDGFILRKSGGTWSKVATDNFGGHLGVLLERT